MDISTTFVRLRMCAYAFLFMLLNVFGGLSVHAALDAWDYFDVGIIDDDDEFYGFTERGYTSGYYYECDFYCGLVVWVNDVLDPEDAWTYVSEGFCPECGGCNEIADEDCYYEHHCAACGMCFGDDGDGQYCEGCYIDWGAKICYDCCSDYGDEQNHCPYCHNHYGEIDDACVCGYWQLGMHHCEGCSDLKCEVCGSCLIVAGDENSLTESPACIEHAICYDCMTDGAGGSEHCSVCYTCESDICDECGMCEDCSVGYLKHCFECDFCFGEGEVDFCNSGGEHCIHCCEDNDWICPQCEGCVEGKGIEMCDDCGLCEECCLENSENEGCTHGYCILSGEYEEHLCPSCMKCPDDQECEYCLLCEDCQEDYHCEHGLCPEGDDWEAHICDDCGDCFDESELCEYCHKCEGCWEHCEHGVCPDDTFVDDDEHFTCTQCDECYEGDERCPSCKLCSICCAANTIVKGCDHGLCIASNEFVENHWCYDDNQCLELCDHSDVTCTHESFGFEFDYDATAHWQHCIDCGAAVNSEPHFTYFTEVVIEPDPETGKQGKARMLCGCGYILGTIPVPCVPIPSDGSPYIITQPKNYTGKTNKDSENVVFTTFRVRAGGENLKYQWYYYLGDGFELLSEWKNHYEGTQTPELKLRVPVDACDPHAGFGFFCKVSNAYGVVRSDTVRFDAQHVFGYYDNNQNGTHSYRCYGECNTVKSTSFHRWGEWKLVRAATETETGLRQQTCLDCNCTMSVVIPKVEPGHEHFYDDLHYTETQHWYSCICGLYTQPEDHVFGSYHVTKEPTEKQYGEQVCYCDICDYEKKEKMDKLPHTHEWYDLSDPQFLVWEPKLYSMVVNPEMGGRSPNQHYVHCKGCDQIKTECHAWPSMWSWERVATKDRPGRLTQQCMGCAQIRAKGYPYGSYPIQMAYGRTDKDLPFARPGETVTIRFDADYAYGIEGRRVKFSKWGDEGYHDPYDTPEGKRYSPVTFANANDSVTTFVMPNGPVAIGAEWDYCDHSGATLIAGSRLEPSCAGYGHEPDHLCSLCHAVLVEGARIEPLGHLLDEEGPIEGTVDIEYCWKEYLNGSYGLNNNTHGYSGDYLCLRCNKAIKGKNKPLVHGVMKRNESTGEWVGIIEGYLMTENMANHKEPTCTTYGHTGEKICYYCGGVYEKGYRLRPLGHEWGEWELIREPSPSVKGLEQRVCLRDESHKETRTTDFSGPHYRIKTECSKVNFEFTVGETPEPQTITFESKGRNEVTGIKAVGGPSGSRRRANGGDSFIDVSVDGMSMTFMPNVEAMMADMTMSEKEVVLINSVLTEDGETTDFTAPKIVVNVKINKLDPNLRMAYTIRNTRPGVSFDAPAVTADVEDLPLQWKSSDNSVAAVDPVTGRVTPMRAYGETTITATYPGNQLYKSSKVSYKLNVIGKQGFEGKLWQDVSDAVSGVQVKTEGEYQQVSILRSKLGDGKVDISFSGFTMPVTNLALPIFTIRGVKVTDYENNTVSYVLSSSEATMLTFGEGSNAQTFRATLEGFQDGVFDVPVLKLTLEGSVTDIIWFGDHFLSLDEVITGVTSPAGRKDEGDIYDLSGRKVKKIQQPGIYIQEGRKVSVK